MSGVLTVTVDLFCSNREKNKFLFNIYRIFDHDIFHDIYFFTSTVLLAFSGCMEPTEANIWAYKNHAYTVLKGSTMASHTKQQH